MLPAEMVVGPARAKEKESAKVTVAVALFEGSATLTAVKETLGDAGMIWGAV